MTMTTKELLALVVESEAADKAYDAQPTPDAARRSEVAHFAVVKAAYQALPALCAEVEALRKDAERWRFARTILDCDLISRIAVDASSVQSYEPYNVECDAAIDAARSRNEHEC